MAINYTILKSSIVNSSIWNEDSDTRIVWITLLALRNKNGEIYASIGGLAHQARVSREAAAAAVAKFLLPEPDSASRDDGRRIVEIEGGWKLINHERVKKEAMDANRAAYMAEYMRHRREKQKAGHADVRDAGDANDCSGVEVGETKIHPDVQKQIDEMNTPTEAPKETMREMLNRQRKDDQINKADAAVMRKKWGAKKAKEPTTMAKEYDLDEPNF